MPDEQSPSQAPQPAFHAMPEKYYLGKQPKAKSKSLLITVIVLVVIALGLGVAYLLTRGAKKGTETNVTANSISPVNTATLNRNSNRNTNSASGNANLNANAAALNTNSTQLNTFPINNAEPPVNDVTNSLFSGNTNSSTITNVTPLPNSVDTDHDGLTDVEELLYGTNKSLVDSDADGFPDGIEVAGGYNPRGTGLITTTNLVKQYLHPMFGYKLLYPSTWLQNTNPQTSNGVIFSTSTGEFVGIDVENNTAKLSARDWYLKASPGIDLRLVVTIQNSAKTLEGVLSLDGQTAYYTSGERAYIISYNTNLLSAVNFRTTFEMMYESFSLTPVVVTNTNSGTTTNTTNGNANTNTGSSTNASTNTGY